MNKYSLLAPGPVNLHPEVRKLLSEPMIHHRTPQFDAILARSLKNLSKIFQTEQPVYALNSTGSGGMEALMVNTLSRRDKVIVINSGKFGERWVEMAKAFDLDVIDLKVSWGHSIAPEVLEKTLIENPTVRAVFCQACETSTATAHPIAALGKIIGHHTNTLFLVDGITAVGAYELPMDQFQIDGLVAGSQKAFMLPTGMSFVSFSKKAWKFIPTANLTRYYFDIRGEDKANRKGETWFSSNVLILRALDLVLTMILDKGLETHFNEISQRAKCIRYFSQRLGFSLYSRSPADSVTAIALPTSSKVDTTTLRQELETRFNITIMGGQDQAKGKILRIGHMGYIESDELVHLILSLQELVKDVNSIQTSITREEVTTWLKKQ